MNEERLQILKMLENGTIKADEAARLLEATEASQPAIESGGRVKWLRIKVQEAGKNTVNVRVPAALLGVANRFIPGGLKDSAGNVIDLQSIAQAVRAGAEGKLVEVDEGNSHIEITVE